MCMVCKFTKTMVKEIYHRMSKHRKVEHYDNCLIEGGLWVHRTNNILTSISFQIVSMYRMFQVLETMDYHYKKRSKT